MAFADTQQLVVKLDLKGNLKAGLGDAARALQGFDRSTSRTQQSLSKFGRNIERGVVVGIAATGTALLGVVKAAADYESAFAGVRKTVTATEPELKQLSDQFRALSKEIPISASELARLGEAGGALGVPTAQLKEFVRVTALLGVTTNLTADEAADSLGILGNVLHLTGEEYSKFASSLVALGNAGASTERDIVAIAERAGAAGALIGVSTEQILGFSSAVASLGIEAEAGGTAIQKFFIDSAKVVAGGGKELKEFAKVAGLSASAFKTAFEKDAGGALQAFLAGLGKLPQAKQLQVLADFGFNDARITRTLLGLANNTKLVSDQMGVANTAFAQNTALTKEAEQRFNTFDSQLQITKNTLTDMAITIGSKLLPKITPLLKRLNEFVGANQGNIERFGDQLATGFEKFATALQKVDWQPFIDGLKLSADIAKKSIDIFRSLPEGLQAALVGGFALNKVTGGLGTSIAKDIGGAVLSRFADRGSSPANPLWVSQVGGIPGIGGAAGAAGGGLLGKLFGIGTKIVFPIAVGLAIAEGLNEVVQAAFPPTAESLAAKARVESDPRRESIRGSASFSDQSGFGPAIKGVGKALDDVALATTRNAQRLQDVKDADLSIAGYAKSTVAAVRRLETALHGDLVSLRRASSPAAIAAAARKVAADVTKGAGSESNTKAVLAELQRQLKNTHDPQLQSVLKTAISQVTVKLPAREYAAKQLRTIDGILKDGKITTAELKQVKQIEKSLKDHGLPHAASVISKRVDAAKTAQVTATHAGTNALKAKKMSVSVKGSPITVNVSTSVADQIKSRVTYKKAGNVYAF